MSGQKIIVIHILLFCYKYTYYIYLLCQKILRHEDLLITIRFSFQKSPTITKKLNEQELDNIWDEKQLQILVNIFFIKYINSMMVNLTKI